jgi:sulfur carrier protein ThiS adenylyltransferase
MTREEYRRILASKRVGIAGAGGLGSNCAVALARAGLGSLVIADFDTVSADNLDRQCYFLDQVGRPKVEALAENIQRIDPSICVVARVVRLAPDSVVDLFAGCNAIVEAFDAAEAKAMIIETVLERMPGVPIVSASGIAGYGRSEDIRVRSSGSLYVVGDLESEVGPDLPPMAPRVGMAAAMQANLVLEMLLG